MDKLNVLAVGEALLPDVEAAERGIRKFVGRKLVETDGRHGFEPIGAVEIPNTEHYRAALAAGDLAPTNEATAKAAGVKWEPIAEPKKAAAKSEGA